MISLPSSRPFASHLRRELLTYLFALTQAIYLSIPTAWGATDASHAIDKIQGDYRHRFRDTWTDGPRFRSTSFLKILKLSPTTAYFSTYLEFLNGHSCTLYGVADLQSDGSLTYWEKGPPVFRSKGASPDGPRSAYQEDREDGDCVFTIRPTQTGLLFEDRPDPRDESYHGGVCRRGYCGSRGGFAGIRFNNSERHPIAAKSVTTSQDFHDALEKRQKCPHAMGPVCGPHLP